METLPLLISRKESGTHRFIRVAFPGGPHRVNVPGWFPASCFLKYGENPEDELTTVDPSPTKFEDYAEEDHEDN